MVNDYGPEIKKLGFGIMRFPHKRLLTDVKRTKRMVDLQCEKACPRHIPIVGKLKECAAALEG